MTRRVEEEPTRERQIRGRRRLGIARRDAEEPRRSDPAGAHALAHCAEEPVEAPVVADLEQHSGTLARLDGTARLGDVEGERLLAEDVLAGLRGRDDHVGMRVGRRRHEDGFDVFAREQALGVERLRAGLLRERSRRLGHDVGDRGQPHTLQRGRVGGVNAGDLARADQAQRVHAAILSRQPSAASGVSGSSGRSSQCTSSRSMREPSILSTRNSMPSHCTSSPSCGARPSSPKTKPATVW